MVGRARDNWKYAHTKSTSALHLLDRFSISLQVPSDLLWGWYDLCIAMYGSCNQKMDFTEV